MRSTSRCPSPRSICLLFPILLVAVGCAALRPPPKARKDKFPAFAGAWKDDFGSRLDVTTSGEVKGQLYLGPSPFGGFLDGDFLLIDWIQPARLRRGSTAEECYFDVKVVRIGVDRPGEKEGRPVRVTLRREGPAQLRLHLKGLSGASARLFVKQE
jgi:hypothetical protein